MYSVKILLSEYGLLYVFVESVEGYQTPPFPFKQRVINIYIQWWHGCLEINQVLLGYKYCKTNFNEESYLNILRYTVRCYFSRLGVPVLPLRIQLSRYARKKCSERAKILLILKMSSMLYLYVLVILSLEINDFPACCI